MVADGVKSPKRQELEANAQKTAEKLAAAFPPLAVTAMEVMAVCTSMIPMPDQPGMLQIAAACLEGAGGTLRATVSMAQQLADGSGTDPVVAEVVAKLAKAARRPIRMSEIPPSVTPPTLVDVTLVLALVQAASVAVLALPAPTPPVQTPLAAAAAVALPQAIQASAQTPAVMTFALAAAISALTVCMAEAGAALPATPSESLDQMRQKRRYDKHGVSKVYHAPDPESTPTPGTPPPTPSPSGPSSAV